MRPTLASIIVTLTLSTTVSGAPPRYYDDACLRGVQFIDRNEGWACGDDGVVWHTIDGGETWERQPTGVRGSLRAVHFINPYTGWVVGREELPGGRSAGILLTTTDGGLKWSRTSPNTLPGLHAVKFFDDRTGIVAGDGNDRYSSGVFSTADGGKTWTIVPGPRQPGWRAADFRDATTGVLGGAWGSIAMMRDNVFGRSAAEPLAGRAILGVKMYQNAALAVGQGGLILKSDDAGGRWKAIEPKALGDSRSSCDFQAVHVLGEHAWVVGRPGTVVLHSGDDGKSWTVHSTRQNMPLHGVYFHDAQAGWAVGGLGTILATTDGGVTWKVQRRGGERAAAMFVHGTPGRTAFDALAQLGGDDGYIAVALCMASPDAASAALAHSGDAERFNGAVRTAGGALGECRWDVPLAEYRLAQSARELTEALTPATVGASGAMVRQMVLSIRMWQPDIVVGDDGGDGVADLCAAALKEAVAAAGDSKAFPDQLQTLGLKPWTPKKLYSTSDAMKNRKHVIRMSTMDPLVRCAESPREVAQLATEHFLDPVATPTERGFSLIASSMQGAESHASLFEGIRLASGGSARRETAAMTSAELAGREEQIKVLQSRRNIEALAAFDSKTMTGADKLLGQLGSMLRSMPPEQGARSAFAVASAFAKSGQWMVARDAYELLATRYPTHPLTAEAYRWLARHAGSAEARRRSDLGQFVVTADVSVQQMRGEAPQQQRVQRTGGAELTGTGSRTAMQGPDAKRILESALELENKMAAFGPLYLHDPSFQMSLTSVRRALGQEEAARKWLTRYAAENPEMTGESGRCADVWREAAAAELWMTARTGRTPRPNGVSRATDQRPTLDGKLDDECWSGQKEMTLRNISGHAGAAYTAKAMFAYDTQFLYIAVQCSHPTGKNVPRIDKRKRDEDLSAFDRVGITLDVDRDYQTAFHFQIDQRGGLSEDCWGDRSWNPKWYVAVHSDANGWTAECAIPLSELTGDVPTSGKAWACNVYRVIPGQGVQAWSSPAGITPRPEGAGLLVFTDEKK